MGSGKGNPGLPGKTIKVTAAQAIGRECKSCCPGQRMTPSKCPTKVCKLSPEAFQCRSSVRRIKAHCLDCAVREIDGTALKAVRACTGRLLRENGNGGTCWLHPFRLGKNPDRPRHTPAPDLGKKGAEVLAKYRRGQRPDIGNRVRIDDLLRGIGGSTGVGGLPRDSARERRRIRESALAILLGPEARTRNKTTKADLGTGGEP